jgi:SAM-dependent methyltransferase
LNRIAREAKRLAAQLRKSIMKRRIGRVWVEGEGTARRSYENYDQYLEHQRLKFDALRTKWLESHDRRFYTALRERLAPLSVQLKGRSVLCLAARQGTEVRAFIDQGAFAIGIDLNPGKNNPYVLSGDFHNLQFAPSSIDVVYTNSIDHAFDLERMLAEIKRVLAADGVLLIEAGPGAEENTGRGFYESLAWASTEQLIQELETRGFQLEQRVSFEQPWKGEQLILRHKA